MSDLQQVKDFIHLSRDIRGDRDLFVCLILSGFTGRDGKPPFLESLLHPKA